MVLTLGCRVSTTAIAIAVAVPLLNIAINITQFTFQHLITITYMGVVGGLLTVLAAKRQRCPLKAHALYIHAPRPKAPQREKPVSRFFHTSASEKL